MDRGKELPDLNLANGDVDGQADGNSRYEMLVAETGEESPEVAGGLYSETVVFASRHTT